MPTVKCASVAPMRVDGYTACPEGPRFPRPDSYSCVFLSTMLGPQGPAGT